MLQFDDRIKHLNDRLIHSGDLRGCEVYIN